MEREVGAAGLGWMGWDGMDRCMYGWLVVGALKKRRG